MGMRGAVMTIRWVTILVMSIRWMSIRWVTIPWALSHCFGFAVRVSCAFSASGSVLYPLVVVVFHSSCSSLLVVERSTVGRGTTNTIIMVMCLE
jgi:hypothetical protein